MKVNNGWNSLDDPTGLSEMEFLLHQVLVPVYPRPDFVVDSKQRLIRDANGDSDSSFKIVRYALFGLAGTVSFVALVITGIHTWPRLLGAMKNWKQIRQPGALEQGNLAPVLTTEAVLQ